MSWLYPDSLIAIGALATSVIALATSVISLKNQQRHNKLSVRPIPKIFVFDGETSVEVALFNKGVGPLRIISFVAKDQAGKKKSNLIDLLPLPPGLGWDYSHINLADDDALRPGEKLVLAKYTEDGETEQDRSYLVSLKKSLATISVELGYTSIYNEEFSKCKKSFDIFSKYLKD